MSLRDPKALTLDGLDWLVIAACCDFAMDNMDQEKAGPVRRRHLELLIEQIGEAYGCAWPVEQSRLGIDELD